MAVLGSTDQANVIAKMRLGHGPSQACSLLGLAAGDYEDTLAGDAVFADRIKAVYQTFAQDALSRLARKARSKGDLDAAAELLDQLANLPFT